MVDLVLHGGLVHDGDRVVPGATAVAVDRGRVVAVGSDADVRARVGPVTHLVDLAGRPVLPGFTDAHVHPVMGGLERLACDVSGATTVEQTLHLVRQHALAHPDAEWLDGGGWHKELFASGRPTHDLLDAAAPGRRVVLRDSSHHAVWASTAALHAAGLPTGPADGTLHEAEMDPVTDLLPRATTEQQLAGLLEAQRHLHSLGVTGWQDAIVGEYAGYGDPTPAYLAAASRGLLTARVVGALWWPRGVPAHRVPDVVAQLAQRRDEVAREVPDGRFRCTSVKVMQDGVVESRTAGLTTPYLDDDGAPGTERGLSYVEPSVLQQVAVACARAGFQLHVHAIGDRAVREALDALAAAQADPASQPDLRHHVAHLQVVDPADVPRFARLGVTANLQALWACHETVMDELNIPLLGPTRSDWQYPFADLARSGAELAMGSDWPVSTPDPLAALAVAVTRQEAPGSRPLLPGQALDLATALRAYLRGSARVNHQDDAGRVVEGVPADLVVLDRDPLAVPPDELASVRCDLTLVDGRAVWERA
ncbi:amidohydrolase [Angustibacter aerolatus]